MPTSSTHNWAAYLGLVLLCLSSFILLTYFESDNHNNLDTLNYDFNIDNSTVVSKNEAQDFRLNFEPKKFKISSSRRFLPYDLTYTLNDIKVNGNEMSLSERPKYSSTKNTLKEDHGVDIDINYRNNDKGLRQDFVIKNGPTENVEFEVNIALETSLTPYQIDNYSIGIHDKDNPNIDLKYKDLVVYDADGKLLKCNMSYEKDDSDIYNINLYAYADKVSYPVTIDPLSTSNTGFESGIDSTFTGFAISGDCDLNNDGYADAVIGSYGAYNGPIKSAGKIDVFYGQPSGIDLEGTPDLSVQGGNTVNLEGFIEIEIGGKFGFTVDCAGDVNDDGFDDLIVGAPAASLIDTTGGGMDTIRQAGAFYVYYGSTNGIQTNGVDTIYGTLDTLSLGNTVAGLGDINGDDFSDIMVSAPGNNQNTGIVNVYLGSATGINAVPNYSFEGSQPGEKYGTALSGPGDINGDGLNDLLIGAHNYTVMQDTAIGIAELYLGNNVALSAMPAWSKTGQHKNEQFGFSVSGAGNFDGVGNNDVIIGANQYNPEYITDMPDTLLTYVTQYSNVTPFDSIGQDTISTYGSGKGIGAVYLYSGIGTGLTNTVTTLFVNDVGSAGFGSAVSYAGDIDGDGQDDIIVGAPFYSQDVANQGAVYAYYGANFQTDFDDTFDWCGLGEKRNAYLGTSIDKFGGQDSLVQIVADTTGILTGAYGFGAVDTLYSGAAFVYKQSTCGLNKYSEIQFLTFPSNLDVSSQPGVCGAIVDFDYPVVGTNCPNPTIEVITGIDSGEAFPVGDNIVTIRVTSEGMTRDSSFNILVTDDESPMPQSCESLLPVIQLDPDMTETVLTWPDPTFTDNSTCSGGTITVNQISGKTKNTSHGVGVYPIVYEAEDESGNKAYCSFRIIISKTSLDGRDCRPQEIKEDFVVPKATLNDANVTVEDQLSNYLNFSNSNFGIKLLLSLFEGATGITLPGWVKASLGEAGSGINLAFVSVRFSFLPSLDVKYGTFYEVTEDTAAPLRAELDYVGDICGIKPPDTFFGCRDTIGFSSSFIINDDPNVTKLNVNPGGLKQDFGVFIKDFEFKWEIYIRVSACIGVPLCVPFFGCAGCAGYTASWESPRANVFDPIRLLPDPGVRVTLVSVCDDTFKKGASIFSVLNCLGAGSGADNFVSELLTWLPVGPDNLIIDPFFYDESKDQFVFDPNRIPVVGNKIPEMDIKFGRLTNGGVQFDAQGNPQQLPNEMGPTFINGTKLTTSGKEKNLISATVDIFSLLYYAIPKPVQQSLACSGIDIGTRTIDIGVPKVNANSGECTVPFYRKELSIDVMDINVTLRSEYDATYSFDPVIAVEEMDLGQPMYWERPNSVPPLSGFSQFIPNVAMDENIKIVVPDGITEPFFIANTFSANGNITGLDRKTQKVDLGINVLEFLPSIWIPTGISPLISLGPYNLLTLGSRNIRRYNDPVDISGFSANISMTPDSIPPTIFCKDTTVSLNINGHAFLDHLAAFDEMNSFDEPIGGTGQLVFLGGYPDTIFCEDYPSTSGFIEVEDDNCNITICEYTVTVLDEIAPQMGCVDITVGIGENGTYFVNPDEIAIGVTDNCDNIEISGTPNSFDCDDVGIPQIVTLMVTDIAGNTNSCTANVTVVDTLPLLLECPYLLSYPVTRSTREGFCFYTADATEFRPTLQAPDCSTVITYELTGDTQGSGMSNVDGINFNLGQTTVEYTATDASGNTTSCSFVVIVEDNEPPVLVCPIDLTIGTDDDLAADYNCSTDYDWSHPRPLDNCTDIMEYSVVYTNPDGTIDTEDLTSRLIANDLAQQRNFPLGTTTIEYTALDTMSNIAICSFDVVVIDDELPMVFCEDVIGCQTYAADGNTAITPNDVTSFEVKVSNDITITDIDIMMSGTSVDLGSLTFELVSPSGTTIPLFANLCPGSTSYDITIDDDATLDINNVSCNPLGGGDTYTSQSPLAVLNGESSLGLWIINVENTDLTACGIMNNLVLNICGNAVDVNMATNVSILTNMNECEFTVSDTTYDPNFEDNCDGSLITHDYIFGPFDNTLQGAILPLGITTITWTITDGSGNTVSCVMNYEIKDQVAPQFINCPANDIIENAETNTCEAFVNFSAPIAFDDCDDQVEVVQIDNTGYSSGDIFPVGMTVLIYQATDISGNSSTCDVRVIVNDTQAGSFDCPADVVLVNDTWECTALVQGIAPINVTDNCIDNVTLTYQIENPVGSGNIIASGVDDASENIVFAGANEVTYQMSSQPTLLISEISQEIEAPIGGTTPVPYASSTNDDYLELTNLGPAAYNVSGLEIERFGNGFSDVFEVPNLTIINPGETLVLHYGNATDDPANNFFNIPCAVDISSSEPAGYVIAFKDRILDVAAINGFNPIGLSTIGDITGIDWSGTIDDSSGTAGIIRSFSFDNNSSNDWVIVGNCYPLTMGAINVDMEAYTWNGATVGLQSIDPQIETCSFMVTINDSEAPFCAMSDGINSYDGTPVEGGFDSCNEGFTTITAAEDCIVSDINITVNGSMFGTDSIFMTLTSPSGKTVVLTQSPCPGNTDEMTSISYTFDDEASQLNNTICASPTGTIQPQEPLLDFYGEKSSGDWSLNIGGLPRSDSYVTIDSWTLDVACTTPFVMDPVVINNEPGLCGSEFSWTHPFYMDNCGSGTISVDYYSDDISLDVPTGGILLDNNGNGGYDHTAFFAVGTTIVEYTLVDQSGVESQCSFTVEVLDIDVPVFVLCPDDITVALDPGLCREIVNYEAIAEDNCEISSIVYTPVSGSYFDIGTTTVTVIATDASDNTTECSFDVIVNDFDPTSGELACNDLINLSLDENCEVFLSADMLLEGNNYYCYEEYVVTLTDEQQNPVTTAPLIGLSYQGQTLQYTVTDPITGNSCWGNILIEEKLIPEIACPVDIVITCDQDPNAIVTDSTASNFNQLVTGEVSLLSCEQNTSWIYEDQVLNMPDCSDPIKTILRTFYLTDDENNTVECTQRIDIEPFSFDNITWPSFVQLECSDVSENESLTHPDNTGYPLIGWTIVDEVNSLCDLSHNYSDNILWICGNSYEILRTWTIRNRCLPFSTDNPTTYTQLIEVLDTQSPLIADCPSDLTISTDPWSCSASISLPLPSKMEDVCSDVSFEAKIFGGGTLSTTGSISNGDLTVNAEFIKSGVTATVRYTLTDGCGNEENCSFDITVYDGTPPVAIATQNIVVNLTSGSTNTLGLASITGSAINNGSYDNCTDVSVEIRRVSDTCDRDGNTTFNADGHENDGSNNLSSPFFDTDNGEYVTFCCEDLTDVDDDGTLYGIVTVEMRVWDDANGDGIFGTSPIAGIESPDNYNTTWIDVRIEDKSLPSLICPLDITIPCDMDENNLDITGIAQVIGNCNIFQAEYTDQANLLCGSGTITRTWSIGTLSCKQIITKTAGTPWMAYGPNGIYNNGGADDNLTWPRDYTGQAGAFAALNCPDDNADTSEPTWISNPCDQIAVSSTIDTFLQEDGACIKKVINWTVLDWCQYAPNDPNWNGEGIWTRSQVIKIIDTNAPTLNVCSDAMYEVDANCVNSNVVLTNTAIDTSECGAGWLKWQVFVDTWGDGNVDYEFSSFVATNTNFNTDANGNGIPDDYLAPTQSGQEVSVTVPETILVGSTVHLVTWKVTDGCGNIADCATTFMVVDKKAPTPYCINISTAIMDDLGTVELWASDFNLGATDNCTSQEDLLFSFSGSTYVPNMTFSESDCGLNQIEIYVWDEAGNNDFCTVDLYIDGDNCNSTNSPRATIAGHVTSENNDAMNEVMIQSVATQYSLTEQIQTSVDGTYAFDNSYKYVDYNITALKDGDDMNGVSTLDLLNIQKHILGVKLLDSPYQVIAADVNNSESVSALDLIELRKLILGLYNELPNNTSWKFVDADQTFSDIYNPWPLKESKQISQLDQNAMQEDFIGVKIGDVNGSASAIANVGIVENRNNNDLRFIIADESLTKGDLVRVDVRSDNFNAVLGYQLTLQSEGLELIDIQSGAIQVKSNQIAKLSTNITTLSWFDLNAVDMEESEVLFTLVFKVNQNGQLSKMIDITDLVTRTESYFEGSNSISGISLLTSDAITKDIVLYQNEPNPFSEVTVIAFSLPVAAQATLSIYSIDGKLIKVINGDYAKGINEIVINKSDINVGGVYYYELESGTFNESKKMILIE